MSRPTTLAFIAGFIKTTADLDHHGRVRYLTSVMTGSLSTIEMSRIAIVKPVHA